MPLVFAFYFILHKLLNVMMKKGMGNKAKQGSSHHKES